MPKNLSLHFKKSPSGSQKGNATGGRVGTGVGNTIRVGVGAGVTVAIGKAVGVFVATTGVYVGTKTTVIGKNPAVLVGRTDGCAGAVTSQPTSNSPKTIARMIQRFFTVGTLEYIEGNVLRARGLARKTFLTFVSAKGNRLSRRRAIIAHFNSNTATDLGGACARSTPPSSRTSSKGIGRTISP